MKVTPASVILRYVASKSLNTKKEPDPSGRLVTDGPTLVSAVGAGKKKPGLRAGWAHDHPTFRPPIVGERRRVLDEVESEYAGEEGDGWVRTTSTQQSPTVDG